MAIVAVAGLHGSPGATSLAIDLARLAGADALLLEADPDGGRLAARLDLAVKPGLTELAGAARVGIAADDVWRYAQPTHAGFAVIVAHPAAEQVRAALRAAVGHVGRALRALPGDVVIDLGRLRPGSPAIELAVLADHTIVIAPNTAESVVALHHRAQLLDSIGRTSVVLGTAKPYAIADVAATSGAEVWGVIALAAGRSAMRHRERAVLQLWADIRPASLPEAAGQTEVLAGQPMLTDINARVWS